MWSVGEKPWHNYQTIVLTNPGKWWNDRHQHALCYDHLGPVISMIGTDGIMALTDCCHFYNVKMWIKDVLNSMMLLFISLFVYLFIDQAICQRRKVFITAACSAAEQTLALWLVALGKVGFTGVCQITNIVRIFAGKIGWKKMFHHLKKQTTKKKTLNKGQMLVVTQTFKNKLEIISLANSISY